MEKVRFKVIIIPRDIYVDQVGLTLHDQYLLLDYRGSACTLLRPTKKDMGHYSVNIYYVDNIIK